MTLKGRLAALAVVVSILLAMIAGNLPLLVVTVVGAGIAWRWLPTFWRTVNSAAAGGALAGLLILAPGFRLAMRIVAIMDPFQRPEFSLEGTMFIMVIVGLLMGGLLGVSSGLLSLISNLRSPLAAGGLAGLLTLGVLIGNSGLREELTDLGGGILVNMALFGTVSLAYGIAAMSLANRISSEPFQQPKAARVGLPQ